MKELLICNVLITWLLIIVLTKCGLPYLKLPSGCCLWVILMHVFAALLDISIFVCVFSALSLTMYCRSSCLLDADVVDGRTHVLSALLPYSGGRQGE